MPSINWLTARAEIATILTGVGITVPITTSILKVFQTPPKQVSDLPCVIVMGVNKADPLRAMAIRERNYTTRLRLLVQDADINRAADVIDALQEAIIDAFDQNLTLNGKVSNLHGPAWEEADALDAGGQTHQGSDGIVTFSMTDDVVFAG